MAIFADNFRRGGLLDAQVRYGGTQAYANYAYGVTMSAYGMPLTGALGAAEAYGATKTYNTRAVGPMAGYIPSSNVANIIQGYNDQKNGTLCTTGSK